MNQFPQASECPIRAFQIFYLGTGKGSQNTSVADPDPGSGAINPLIRDPGWVESQHPEPGSGMNNPDHIFYSLENIFLG
jgi:hypothetical protein